MGGEQQHNIAACITGQQQTGEKWSLLQVAWLWRAGATDAIGYAIQSAINVHILLRFWGVKAHLMTIIMPSRVGKAVGVGTKMIMYGMKILGH